MDISDNGVQLIKQFEGFRPMPYQDQAGLWTIGYGVRIPTPNLYPSGITMQEAATLLSQHVIPVAAYITSRVTVSLTQNAFDALCSLTYNIGINAFGNSTLLKVLNMGSYTLAANEFLKWDNVNGQPDAGLLNRRQKEQELFLI